MHIQLDTLGGIAGDMFIAAVLDAWPELADETLAGMRAAGLPPESRISVTEHRDHVLRGRRFELVGPPGGNSHIRFPDLVRRIREAPLSTPVTERAVTIFELLARAEADVHGVAVDEVTFHEVGAWDSVADIVGAAHLIEALQPASWSAGPIPLGGGRIATAHGTVPVPAPATVELLKGFALVDDGIQGERVTPTGAAILRYLQTAQAPQDGPRPMTLTRHGTGFGTRTLPGISNVLRVLVFEDSPRTRTDERIGVIHFEVDDQTAEDLAVGIRSLRSRDGVLDVVQMPAFGKKERMLAHIQVLCRREALPEVIDACFTETTTLGLRWTTTARATLERKVMMVESEDTAVEVKLATRPDGRISAKTGMGSLEAAPGHAERQEKRARAERRARLDAERDGSCPGE